jgi:hypothetical protein
LNIYVISNFLYTSEQFVNAKNTFQTKFIQQLEAVKLIIPKYVEVDSKKQD